MVKPSLRGVVISQGNMDKTVKVRVQKLVWNNLVAKYLTDHKNYLVHDELNKCREGDVVRIQYVRPLSTRKSWAVADIMKLQGASWQKYKEAVPGQVREEELDKLREFQRAQQERLNTQGEDAVVIELRQLEAALHNKAELPSDRLDELKAKYNITSWPPRQEVVKLSITELGDRIEQLRAKIEDSEAYSTEARRLLQEEPDRANEILSRLGKNPEVLKSGVKRNILLKHLKSQANV